MSSECKGLNSFLTAEANVPSDVQCYAGPLLLGSGDVITMSCSQFIAIDLSDFDLDHSLGLRALCGCEAIILSSH